MRIGISTRGLYQGSYAVSSIVLNLTQTLIDLVSGRHEIYLYFNHPDFPALFHGDFKQRSITLNNRFIWDHFWLPYVIRKDRIDIALFMKGTIPLLLPCRGAVIYHDLGYFDQELRPYKYFETIYMKKMMASSGHQAAKIFADSSYTRNEAIRILGVDPQKIFVCYQNCASIYQPVRDQDHIFQMKANYQLPSEYIFCPTSLSPRKNLDRILSAFDHVKSKIPHHLVITGGQTWREKRVVERVNSELSPRVHILGKVPERDMPALYSNAGFTLYPSLLEGFGLPILEAFRCGCPVITSNITSMPEVAGEAAYLVDPYDTDEISESIQKLATDESLGKDLIQKGFERAKFFSWEKTAGIILDQLLETEHLS